MKPLHHFSDFERNALRSRLLEIEADPYRDYAQFCECVIKVAGTPEVLDPMAGLCERIRSDRDSGASDVHALRNCPVDLDIPLLDRDNPLEDKYRSKKTHVSEAFLALLAHLTRTPLLSYGSRHGGDFFTDVIAIKRYENMATGFSAGDLVYHNDRTSHPVRADFISLLGMRCSSEDLVYTIYVDGKDLLSAIPEELQEVLRGPYFQTPYDAYSQALNKNQVHSDAHAILEGGHCFRDRSEGCTGCGTQDEAPDP